MKIKVAKYIAEFLAKNGICHNFTVTGGGAMHLNDALGHHPEITSIYNHHEQACAIAAEAYARLTGNLACVCVTSGPGGTNAITGVLGGWLDSIPMFILSGQVKRETTTWSTNIPVRQLGDQEYNIVASVRPMTKYAHMITEEREIRYHLEKMLYLALHGRKGPVWLDVPLDVQAAVVETDELVGFDAKELEQTEDPVYDKGLTEKIIEKLQHAKRPVILAGSGIRLGHAYNDFLAMVDKFQLPVVTAWNAHDVLWDEHPCFCGRPGTVGTRGGNFIVENCDVLLVLGCRLNIRQISYNYKEFAKQAYKIVVDIDAAELEKPTLQVDLPIHADLKEVLPELLRGDFHRTEEQIRWMKWSRDINEKYPAVLPAYYEVKRPMNPYAFMAEFFQTLDEGDDIICGNGSACVITFQAAKIKKNQRLRQTQTNLFQPPLVGVCDGNGLSFPDAEKIAQAYGISFVRIDDLDDTVSRVKQVLYTDGPVFCEVIVDSRQNFAPKLSSKVLPDGKIVSPPIDDMFPFLSKKEYQANKDVSKI